MSNESCISAAPSQRPTSALCCLLTLVRDTDRSCVFRRLRRLRFWLENDAEKQALHFADASAGALSQSGRARRSPRKKCPSNPMWHVLWFPSVAGSESRPLATSTTAAPRRRLQRCARTRNPRPRHTDDYRKGPSNCAISSRRARAAASFATAPRRAAHPDGKSHVPAEAALAGSLTRAPLRPSEMRSRSEPYMWEAPLEGLPEAVAALAMGVAAVEEMAHR